MLRWSDVWPVAVLVGLLFVLSGGCLDDDDDITAGDDDATAGDDDTAPPPCERTTSGAYLQVTAGDDHTCALAVDGQVLCWGRNEYRQSQPPEDVIFTQISAGYRYTCGVDGQSDLHCWYSDPKGSFSDVTIPPTGVLTEKVCTGDHMACALSTSGVAACWGMYSSTEAEGPFVDLACGARHACGLRTDGQVVCWGFNDHGQADAPEDVLFSHVSTGDDRTCGVTQDGAIQCWGSPPGSLQVPPPDGVFTQVALGRDFTCGLREDGTAECWGGYTELPGGLLAAPACQFTSIVAGVRHACGLLDNGELICWGDNSCGESEPQLEVYLAYSVGVLLTCGVTESSEPTCWSTACFEESPYPFRIDVLPQIQAAVVDAGQRRVCFLDGEGTAECVAMSEQPSWPEGYEGQLPLVPPEDSVFAAIATCANVACGLRHDGQLECWGDVEYPTGRLPPPTGAFSAVSGSKEHFCGLLQDGEMVCWGGDNSNGQLDAPPGPFVQVSAGYGNSCGIDGGETVHCWGEDTIENGVPEGPFTEVAPGRVHACALGEDGVLCWGLCGHDPYPVDYCTPPASTKIVHFGGVGDSHSCGLTSSGTAECWGAFVHH